MGIGITAVTPAAFGCCPLPEAVRPAAANPAVKPAATRTVPFMKSRRFGILFIDESPAELFIMSRAIVNRAYPYKVEMEGETWIA
jgi:hypothetical protein